MRGPRPASLARLVLALVTVVFPVHASDGDDPGALGREVYERACKECHGGRGKGDGAKARRLRFRARDLGLASFKCRCTASGELASDDDLVRTVTRGLAGSPMPGFADTLSGDEIRAVVAHVKTLSPRYQGRAAPPCLEVPEPPPATERAIAEGRHIYRLLQCWQCHGASGLADGPSAGELEDDWGHPIRPRRFAADRFLCGHGERDLFRTIVTGMNGSPMPSYEESLLYPREAADSLGAVAAYSGEAAAAELRAYLAAEPDRAALAALDAAAKKDLARRRAWSLVHFLRTLIAEP